jgi:osmotically-inducible protein OsmY
MGKDPVSKTKDVRAAVEKELGFDPGVDATHIAVRNIAGDVTLTGTVPSYPQYLEAATRRAAGRRGDRRAQPAGGSAAGRQLP